jgi:hypothetical protein
MLLELLCLTEWSGLFRQTEWASRAECQEVLIIPGQVCPASRCDDVVTTMSAIVTAA